MYLRIFIYINGIFNSTIFYAQRLKIPKYKKNGANLRFDRCYVRLM